MIYSSCAFSRSLDPFVSIRKLSNTKKFSKYTCRKKSLCVERMIRRTCNVIAFLARNMNFAVIKSGIFGCISIWLCDNWNTFLAIWTYKSDRDKFCVTRMPIIRFYFLKLISEVSIVFVKKTFTAATTMVVGERAERLCLVK